MVGESRPVADTDTGVFWAQGGCGQPTVLWDPAAGLLQGSWQKLGVGCSRSLEMKLGFDWQNLASSWHRHGCFRRMGGAGSLEICGALLLT